MRFTAATLALSLLAVSKLVVAVPPACLLAAVATEQNPGDLNTLCGSDSIKVQQQIVKLCGGATQQALKAYSSTCSGAGKTVSIISASAEPTGSPIAKNSTIVYTSSYFDSSCSCTKTTEISTTTAITSYASASATATSGSHSGSGSSGSGSGSTSATGSSGASTGGAALNPKGHSVGSLAAAVIALAGMAIAL